MKFKKSEIYHDPKYDMILKFSHKYKGNFIFIEQELENGVLKTWGSLNISKRVYSENTAKRLIEYKHLKV